MLGPDFYPFVSTKFMSTLNLLLIAIVVGTLILVSGTFLGILIARRFSIFDKRRVKELSTPINQLSTMINGFAGDMSTYGLILSALNDQISTIDGEEMTPAAARLLITDLVNAQEKIQQRLAEAQAELNKKATQIQSLTSESRTDKLTKLPNRRAIDDELSQRMLEWRRYRTVFSLVIIDIDHFKKFNDQHGHLIGDAVLADVAQVLQSTFRNADVVGRYGGEEFAVIMPSTHSRRAIAAATRTCQVLAENPLVIDGQDYHVTASFGVAEVKHDESIEQLLHRADIALYAAKQNGRNCVWWHDGEKTYRINQADCDQAELSESLSNACSTLKSHAARLVSNT
jgi:diguanylate cyclase